MHVLICLVKWLRAAWIKNITIKKLRYCCDHISIICHRCGPAQGRFLQELGIARGLGVFPIFFLALMLPQCFLRMFMYDYWKFQVLQEESKIKVKKICVALICRCPNGFLRICMYYYLKFQGFPEEIRVNYDRGKKTKRLAVSIVLHLSDYTSLFADSFSHHKCFWTKSCKSWFRQGFGRAVCHELVGHGNGYSDFSCTVNDV